MSDISKLTIEGIEYDIKDETARADIEAIREELMGTSAMADEVLDVLDGISSEDDFIGIKYSNYSGDYYNLPKTADARSLDKILNHPNASRTETDNCLNFAFANKNKSSNNGYFAQLEEVYLPTKATVLHYTFDYCVNLTTIHGDLSNIEVLSVAFRECLSLNVNAVLARMSNLRDISGNSFYGCTQITELTLPATVTSIHSSAFGGCVNVTDVYCPWAEGAVANAPWGMTNATIHYNHNAEV